MSENFLQRAVAGASLMRPRTIVDLYERIRQLSKKTEDESALVRRRIDEVQQKVTSQIEKTGASARKEIERLQTSMSGDLRGLLTAVQEGDAERQRMSQSLGQAAAATSEQLAALLDQVRVQNHQLEQLTALANLEWTYRDEVAAWASLDRDAIVQHLRRAIENATLEHDPCPHFVIGELLPRWFYDMVIEALPPAVFFPDRRPNKQQTRVPFGFAPTYSRLVWQYVRELVDDVAGPAIIARLKTDIDDYVRTFCPPAPLGDGDKDIRYKMSDGRIMLRRAGYEILPHRDPKWGFVTALVYLAKPGDPKEYGTELYRVRQHTEAPSQNPFYVDQSECELARKVPFEANTALVCLNSRGAHGACIPPDAPDTLERYLYQFRVGPDKSSIVRLLELMTDDAKALWAGGKMNKALEAY